MRLSLSVLCSSLLGLLLVSTIFVGVVHATVSVGNDDAEFGFPSSISSSPVAANVQAQAIVSSTIEYTGGNGYVSLQYNPDEVASQDYQTGPWYGGNDWFQTGIIGASSSNCAVFTIQVYNMFWGTTDWSWYSNGDTCQTVGAMFNAGATWSIDEYTNVNNEINGKIFAVSFSVVGGSGGGSYSYTENTPTSWYWLRSNICLCGTDYQTADFTAGAGTLSYIIRPNCSTCVFIAPPFGVIPSPVYIETGENSNMNYGCVTTVSSVELTQAFGLSGAC